MDQAKRVIEPWNGSWRAWLSPAVVEVSAASNRPAQVL
jgi:hypothetical protein